MRLNYLALIALAGMLGSTPCAGAQYPFNFMAAYDQQTMLTLTGKVTKVDWNNPLVHVSMDVSEPSGKVTAWLLEGYPPNTLKRIGFTRELLNVGDTITVIAFRARDGSNTAAMREVTFPDGSKKVAVPAPAAR